MQEGSDLRREVEAKSGASRADAQSITRAVEFREDIRAIRFGDADTCVFHENFEKIFAGRQR